MMTMHTGCCTDELSMLSLAGAAYRTEILSHLPCYFQGFPRVPTLSEAAVATVTVTSASKGDICRPPVLEIEVTCGPSADGWRSRPCHAVPKVNWDTSEVNNAVESWECLNLGRGFADGRRVRNLRLDLQGPSCCRAPASGSMNDTRASKETC